MNALLKLSNYISKKSRKKVYERGLSVVYSKCFEGRVVIIDHPSMEKVNLKVSAALPDGRIVVDEHFIILPTEMKKFFLYHELGHHDLGHINEENVQGRIKKRKSMALDGKVSEEELQADAYAARRVGTNTAINSLKYVLDNLQNIEIGELILRIKHLKLAEDKSKKEGIVS